MGVYEKNIIPIKISHLAAYVARVKRISLDDALVYIYAKQIGISVVLQVPMRLGCILLQIAVNRASTTMIWYKVLSPTIKFSPR